MPRYMTNISAKALLEGLEKEGHAPPQQSAWLADFIAESNRQEDLPMYLRLLVGVGALLSSGFLLAFLSITRIIDFRSEGELLFWGVLFILNAIIMISRAGARGVVGHSYFLQASFCSMGVGKILFVGGFVNLFTGGQMPWAACFATLLVTAATWNFYKLSLDRFLSAFAVLVMLLLNILFERDFGAGKTLVLDFFFLCQLAAAGFLFTGGKVTRDLMPAAYALLASLGLTVGLFVTQNKIGWGAGRLMLDPAFMNVMLSGALVCLIGWAAGGIEKLKQEPLALAATGVALLGIVSAPGVIFSVGLMVLGYARLERPLVAAGALSMPFFLFVYYHNMDVTLLAKSGILVASGAVLLAGKFYMSARNIGREEAA